MELEFKKTYKARGIKRALKLRGDNGWKIYHVGTKLWEVCYNIYTYEWGVYRNPWVIDKVDIYPDEDWYTMTEYISGMRDGCVPMTEIGQRYFLSEELARSRAEMMQALGLGPHGQYRLYG